MTFDALISIRDWIEHLLSEIEAGSGQQPPCWMMRYPVSYYPLRNCARGLVRARLTMHRGTVLGDANKRPVPKNSPVMHCQRRYYQASCAIPKWLIEISGSMALLTTNTRMLCEYPLRFSTRILAKHSGSHITPSNVIVYKRSMVTKSHHYLCHMQLIVYPVQI